MKKLWHEMRVQIIDCEIDVILVLMIANILQWWGLISLAVYVAVNA